MKAKLFLMYPDDVAPPAIKGMLAGKAVVVPGIHNKLSLAISKLIPRSQKMRLLEKIFRKYKEES